MKGLNTVFLYLSTIIIYHADIVESRAEMRTNNNNNNNQRSEQLYDTYPAKYWPRSQCPLSASGLSRQKSLDECREGCTALVDCTAFHYHSSGRWCEHVNCPIPAPEPSGTFSGLQAYSIKEVAASTTVPPTTAPPTTAPPSTAPPTTAPPTTAPPTTAPPTTAPPTTAPPTTAPPTTAPPPTAPPSTAPPTTAPPTTAPPTTAPPTTAPPPTAPPTTAPPTMAPPTTAPPNTAPPPTAPPTTAPPTTAPPTTAPPTTAPPTTAPPTTAPPTTSPSTTIPYYTGCGGHLTSSRGIMSSPNYPNKYNNNCDCFWYIEVPPGHTISINFNFMEIEYHRLCIYDALIVRDGGSMRSPILGGRMCGAHTYNFPHLTTTGHEAYIHFRSDYINTYRGFELTWKTVAIEECPTHQPCPNVTCPPCTSCPPKLTCPTVTCPEDRSVRNISVPLQSSHKSFDRIVRNCGRSFTDETGNFCSPGWPDHYSNNLDCFWTITTGVGKKINLEFTDMEVEFQRLCRYDSIIFRDGNSPTSPMIGQKICGGLHPLKGLKISSTGNEIFIHFRSDYTEYRKGFSIDWTSESINKCPPPPTCAPETECECETCPTQSTCPPPVTCPPQTTTPVGLK